MGPSETTCTDPLTTTPWPWVEIVSSPRGSISVWMLRAPSSVTSSSPVRSTTEFRVHGLALLIVKVEGGPDRMGGHVHEHQIGDDARPIGEMRKVQGAHSRSGLGPGWNRDYCQPR